VLDSNGRGQRWASLTGSMFWCVPGIRKPQRGRGDASDPAARMTRTEGIRRMGRERKKGREGRGGEGEERREYGERVQKGIGVRKILWEGEGEGD